MVSSRRLPVRPYAPSRVNSEAPFKYDDAVISWQRSLTEGQLRELAADYLMGKVTCETLDAYEEYKRRFPEEDKVSRKRPSA